MYHFYEKWMRPIKETIVFQGTCVSLANKLWMAEKQTEDIEVVTPVSYKQKRDIKNRGKRYDGFVVFF